jgi:hypothetical protein
MTATDETKDRAAQVSSFDHNHDFIAEALRLREYYMAQPQAVPATVPSPGNNTDKPLLRSPDYSSRHAFVPLALHVTPAGKNYAVTLLALFLEHVCDYYVSGCTL